MCNVHCRKIHTELHGGVLWCADRSNISLYICRYFLVCNIFFLFVSCTVKFLPNESGFVLVHVNFNLSIYLFSKLAKNDVSDHPGLFISMKWPLTFSNPLTSFDPGVCLCRSGFTIKRAALMWLMLEDKPHTCTYGCTSHWLKSFLVVVVKAS